MKQSPLPSVGPNIATLEQAIDRDEVRSVCVAITDTAGQLIGKRCSPRYFLEKRNEGFSICGLMLSQDIAMQEVAGSGLVGAATGYGDMVMRPDCTTTVLLPPSGDTALLLADCHNPDATELAIAPRTVLKRQISRLADHGLSMMMASELEFHVYGDSMAEISRTGRPPQQPITRYDADGHVDQLLSFGELCSVLQSGFDQCGIPTEYIKFEGGHGQMEIVVGAASAIAAADRHVLQKQLVRHLCRAEGLAASFMALPVGSTAGSGCHIHYSLRDQSTGANAGTPKKDNVDRPLSPLAASFLAGQVKYARDIFAFLAPTVNSYRRFAAKVVAGPPASATWGTDDRNAAFRIVGGGAARHVECRLPGADINPYLAYAGLIAAGISGIEEKLGLDGVTPVELPPSLESAGHSFAQAPAIKKGLGAELTDHFQRYISAECQASHAAVTDWERARYFERI